jgi:hypothetical protein
MVYKLLIILLLYLIKKIHLVISFKIKITLQFLLKHYQFLMILV